MYKCICGKEFEKSQSLNAHYSHCLIHRNGKKPIDRFLNTRNWNKGLSKETDERVKKFGESYSNNIKTGKTVPGRLGKHISEKTREILSIKQSINHSGGICKWYDYRKPNGISQKLQGTWEVKFASYLNVIDEDWIKIGIGKHNHTFIWIDDNKNKRRYTPDFWCPNLQKYFEVKGYWRDCDRIKMKLVIEQNDINVEIIEEKQMKELKLI